MRRVAKVDRSAGPTAGKRVSIRTAKSGVRIPLPSVSLATERNRPLDSFDGQAIWIHALPGVGKTTLSVAMDPMTHLFCFEAGALYTSSYQKPVNSWLEWVAYKDAFKKSKFKWGVVDVVDDAYEMCYNFMCEEVLKIDHPSDEDDYGKSWNAIYSEFVKQMVDFATIPGKGKIFLSHTSEKKFTPAFGESYEVLRPPLPSKPLDRLLAKIDLMGYLYRDPRLSQNVLQIRPDGVVMAKTRPTEQYLFTDGTAVQSIRCGNSPQETVAAMRKAFANQLIAPKAEPVRKLILKPRAK
jgi:hypothetical protein